MMNVTRCMVGGGGGGESDSDSEGVRNHHQGHTVAATSVGSGGMNLVHVTLSSAQNTHSVIQASPHSVIHSAGLGMTPNLSADSDDPIASEAEVSKKQKALYRRPSYRKILNELETSANPKDDLDCESSGTSTSQEDEGSGGNIAHVIPSYSSVMPSGQIHIANVDGSTPNLLTMTNSGSGGASIVQYATQSADGQLFLPASGASYFRTPQGLLVAAPSGIDTTRDTNSNSPGGAPRLVEEVSRKRELRLLKNREAARECRRKKKEYIKCLENRVAVLENQNKTLVEELKALKDLYCHNKAVVE